MVDRTKEIGITIPKKEGSPLTKTERNSKKETPCPKTVSAIAEALSTRITKRKSRKEIKTVFVSS